MAHGMALGASARIQKESADVAAVVGLSDDAGADVQAGAALARFARAAIDREADLTLAREALTGEVGREGLVDAAAMAGFFDGINRVADATGITVPDEWSAAAAALYPDADLLRADREAPRA